MFKGGTSFVDLLCFCSVLCLLCFVRVCLYVLRGHLLGKGWPLGSRLWCLLWVCYFPIGILGQVWYLIVSIPDLCNLTYFYIEYNVCSICKRIVESRPKFYISLTTIYYLIHLCKAPCVTYVTSLIYVQRFEVHFSYYIVIILFHYERYFVNSNAM